MDSLPLLVTRKLSSETSSNTPCEAMWRTSKGFSAKVFSRVSVVKSVPSSRRPGKVSRTRSISCPTMARGGKPGAGRVKPTAMLLMRWRSRGDGSVSSRPGVIATAISSMRNRWESVFQSAATGSPIHSAIGTKTRVSASSSNRSPIGRISQS